MGLLSSIMSPEIGPVKEALEIFEKELEEFKTVYEKEISGLKEKLSVTNAKLLSNSETISRLENKVASLEKVIKTSSIVNQSSQPHVVPQNTPESQSKSVNNQGSNKQSNNQTGPIKRYFSSCGSSGFEISFMLSDPTAINGQGYYEIIDNGNETGIYRPNLELAATLLMNASNMLDPYFDVQHDNSGKLKIIAPGEVLRQGRTWQIVEKCKIAY